MPMTPAERLEKARAAWAASGAERSASKTPWEKFREKPTRTTAIKAFCCMCMGWEEGQGAPPGLRAFVRDCTSPGCPLFEFRPYKGKDADKEDADLFVEEEPVEEVA